jgi:hypothetical protein
MGKYSLIIVAALIFSLLTYSYALRNATFQSNARTVQSFSQNQAHNIAQSALMVAINDIRNDPADSDFHPVTDEIFYYPSEDGFADWGDMHGYYNVSATNQGDTLLIVQSTGRFEETDYVVTAGLVKASGGGFA